MTILILVEISFVFKGGVQANVVPPEMSSGIKLLSHEFAATLLTLCSRENKCRFWQKFVSNKNYFYYPIKIQREPSRVFPKIVTPT